MTATIRRNIIPKNAPKHKIIFFQSFEGIDNLIEWINKHRVAKDEYKRFPKRLLEINFSRVKHLKPYHIASLSCLIHEYQSKGFAIKIKKASTLVQNYLDSFGFNQFCSKKYKNNFWQPNDEKIFPLWKIEQEKVALYPNKIQEYFERNQFNGKSLSALSISLAELLNNVFDHSGSSISGYTFTQYNSTTNSIIVSVCDFGVGIPNKVNEYLQSKGETLLGNMEALKKAFQNRFSTQSKPHNRGFGLDNILSNVKALNSKMLILSNNSLYRLLDDEESFYERGVYFPGTLVVIWLDTKKLPEREEILTDEMDLL